MDNKQSYDFDIILEETFEELEKDENIKDFKKISEEVNLRELLEYIRETQNPDYKVILSS